MTQKTFLFTNLARKRKPKPELNIHLNYDADPGFAQKKMNPNL